MSAQDNLSMALFHGTMAKLAPGDIIEPKKGLNYGAALAFATPDHNAAKAFATDRKGNKGYIYHVEPVDNEEVSGPFRMSGTKSAEYQSKKGFKVIKRVSRRMSLEQQNALNKGTN